MKTFIRTLLLCCIGLTMFSACCKKKNEPVMNNIEGKTFATTKKGNNTEETETFRFVAGKASYSHHNKVFNTKEESTRTLTGIYHYDAERKLYVLKLDKEKVESSGQAKIEQEIDLTWTLTISSDGQTITVRDKDDKESSTYRLIP